MEKLVNRATPVLRGLARRVRRQIMRRVPPSASRLTGTLAKDGGHPVRDLRFRPWATPASDGLASSLRRLPAGFRQIYRSGIEGLPQPLGKQFAQQWAEYCGCRYGLLLPHGTDALRFALAAVLDHDGLDYGGEVIVPNLSFIASATAALHARFGVAFVDVDPATLLIDPRRVEEAIVPGRTRAIMPVHIFGQPADMTALRDIAKRHNLKIVEDAAQAHGSALDVGPSGSLGDVAGFSFQSSKNLACGEGGALTTNDEDVFERAYSIHDAGRPRQGRERWSHVTLGWNCRATEYQAAVLLHRFASFQRQQEKRLANFMKLRELLAEVACVEPLAIHAGVRRHGAHMFVMRYRPQNCGGLLLSDFLATVRREGAPVERAYAATVANQPAIRLVTAKRPDYFRTLPTPVADQAAKEIIYIPQEVFLGTEADMVEILAIFRKVQDHYGPGAARLRTARRDNEEPPVQSAAPVVEVSETLRPMRCGIIGVGTMGETHANVVAKHSLVSLAAVTDANPEGRTVAQAMGCKWFDTPEQMISSGEVDAVIIATPHWQHAQLSIAGLDAGLHVICEKPLCVTVSQADTVLGAAKQSKGIFAVVHQSRFEPAYQEVKRLLDSGELGPLLRCSMVETSWRSEAYYKGSPWRGTWKGEGGGVLLNQAPHVLDRYAWLCGMPERVSGLCSASVHDLEVEDSASAVLWHSGGAHGYIHVSTNECPSVARTVISCDKGRIVLEGSVIRVTKLGRSIRAATVAETRHWGDIEGETQEFGVGPGSSLPELLSRFYKNVALAAANKATLVCRGDEGIHAVELANAIILSSARGREVRLPLERADYAEFLATKIGASAND